MTHSSRNNRNLISGLISRIVKKRQKDEKKQNPEGKKERQNPKVFRISIPVHDELDDMSDELSSRAGRGTFKVPTSTENPEIEEALKKLQESSGDLDGPEPTVFVQLDSTRVLKKRQKLQTSSKLLDALRAKIERLVVVHHNSVIRVVKNKLGEMKYYPLPERIIGAAIIKTSAANFLIGQTRSSWFALYDVPPETLYDRLPALMEIDFKRTDIVSMPTNGPLPKTLYVSSLTTKEVGILQRAAALSAQPQVKPASSEEKTRLSIDPNNFSLKSTLEILRKYYVLETTDRNFNYREFVDNIKFIVPLEGKYGNHLYVVFGKGEEEHEAEIYLSDAPPVKEMYRESAVIAKGAHFCYLYFYSLL